MKGKRYILFFLLFYLLMPSFCYSKTIGLFVGTARYDKGISNLPPCADDARDMSRAMQEQGVVDEVGYKLETYGRDYLRGHNKKSDIRSAMVNDLPRQGEESDTLILYFSGHGTKKGVVTSDGQIITASELSQWISKSSAQRVLLVQDTCFSGNFKLDVPGKTICQIASSSPPMVSFVSAFKSASGHENSVFTKYFVEALRPENSDTDGDGNIRAGEILKYVKKRMLFDETVKMQELDETDKYASQFKSIVAAKEAMDENYNNYQQAKAQGNKEKMDLYAKKYWIAKRAYDLKYEKIERRWQSPIVIGDEDFIVVRKKIEGLHVKAIYMGNPGWMYKGNLDIVIDSETKQAKVSVDMKTIEQHIFGGTNTPYYRWYRSSDSGYEVRAKELKDNNTQRFVIRNVGFSGGTDNYEPDNGGWVRYPFDEKLGGIMSLVIDYDRKIAKGHWWGYEFRGKLIDEDNPCELSWEEIQALDWPDETKTPAELEKEKKVKEELFKDIGDILRESNR